MAERTKIENIIDDISDIISDILQSIQGIGFQDYRIDRKLKIYIVRKFLEIDALAKSVYEEEESAYPHVPWKELRTLIDNFVNSESGVDDNVIWDKARRVLSSIQKKLDKK